MVNEVIRVLNTTYGKKRVRPLNKVCDYYNDGLYKKVKSKTMNIKSYEILNAKKNSEKIEIHNKEKKAFARDLINREFKLLDLEKQKIITLRISNNEKENYEGGIVNVDSPLTHCLINKRINDIIQVRSLDNRKSLVTEYKILEMI